VFTISSETLRVEKGNKATDWSPAPEDIEQTAKSYTDQKADEITQVVSKKVGADEIISKINQTAEKITIDASKLNLTGYVTIENLKGSGTTEINGANIITGSIDADKLNVTDLSALNASIGGFRITEDGLYSGSLLDGINRNASLTNGNNNKPGFTVFSNVDGSSENRSFGRLMSDELSWRESENGVAFIVDKDGVVSEKFVKIASKTGAGASLTDYSLQISPTSGNHMNIGQRTIQTVTKDNKATNLYLNSYGGNVQLGNDSSNMTFGGASSTSIKIANKELIGVLKGTTPTIVTRTLTLNAMSLAGNYDGETTGTIKSVSGYEVLAVIPRTSGAMDVCWINCYFDSSNVVHARLKNTVSSAKNNFKPTVEVLYRLI